MFVAGTTGARTGISMKGGTLVVGGSVGYMSGFMMQRGTMIVCGDAADGSATRCTRAPCTSAAAIASLGADCIEAELTDDDRAMLDAELEPHGIAASGVDWKKLVAGKKLWNFSKHEYDAWREAL